MTLTLTAEQESTLAAGGEVEVEDADTRSRYTILPRDVYDRLKGASAPGRFDVSDLYAAQTEVFAPGWSDPRMAAYDDYDAAPKP